MSTNSPATGRKRVDELVEQYLNAVRSRKSEKGPGDELFSTLIEPTLAGLKSQSRLVVLPDGRLHLLPFDALRDRNEGFVLESHIVTYAPSATVLTLLRQEPHADQAKMNFLGVGGVKTRALRWLQLAAAQHRIPAQEQISSVLMALLSHLSREVNRRSQLWPELFQNRANYSLIQPQRRAISNLCR
jgi:CHAT domain-containing protein